jgi:hypothetical protein
MLVATDERLMAMSHGSDPVYLADVRDAITLAEIALRKVLVR